MESDRSVAFTVEQKALLIRYLENAPFNITGACEAVGIDRATFYRHCQHDLSLARRLQQLKDRRVDEIEEHLMDNARRSDHPAWTIFALKSHRPQIYSPAHKTEANITITIDHNGLTDAFQRQQFIETELVQEIGLNEQESLQSPHNPVESEANPPNPMNTNDKQVA